MLGDEDVERRESVAGAPRMRGGVRRSVRQAMVARGVERHEVRLLLTIVVLGLAVRLGFVALTQGHQLVGDEILYDSYGQSAADGHWFWASSLGQEPHPSLWKPPGYPLLVMVAYVLFGSSPDTVFVVQALVFGPSTIILAWLLARDLFGRRSGVLAAAVTAVYPGTWQFEVRLFAEGIAAPLALVVFLLVLERGAPSTRRAVLLGGVMAANVLVRTTAVYLFAFIGIAWWIAVGFRTATVRTATALGVTLLLIAPWTIRNRAVDDSGFVLLSVQDAAVYGTFNESSANSPDKPYHWQPFPPSLREELAPLLESGTEIEFRDAAQELAMDYVTDHPESVPQAVFWNGLSRLWDIRRPAFALDEVKFQGRVRGVAVVHLLLYYPILLLTLTGLWRWRRHRELVLPLLVMVAAMALIFSIDAGTRYRAATEPLLVVLAAGALVGTSPRSGDRDAADA